VTPQVASGLKVGFHKAKVLAYLRGEPILPACLELDITSACNRDCPGCPSMGSPHSGGLGLEFVSRLFDQLQGQTTGLLLSGGEPTIAPSFPEVVRLARASGFHQVAVVTNGGLPWPPPVIDALLRDVSAVRVSLYDWADGDRTAFESTLRSIHNLREQIEKQSSGLQIGVTALTSGDRAALLRPLAAQAAAAGAHWMYFHPICSGWEEGAPAIVDQTGVLEAIDDIVAEPPPGLRAYVLRERYADFRLHFGSYHAAHFLLVVGADYRNYLTTELKYHPEAALVDLSDGRLNGFLGTAERLQRIGGTESTTYPGMRSRYRTLLYNHYIEQWMHQPRQKVAESLDAMYDSFLFPHIL